VAQVTARFASVFVWLITGQALADSPAAAVRRPRVLQSVTRDCLIPLFMTAVLYFLAGCAGVTGYAQDPATDPNLSPDLREGFGQALKDQYIEARDSDTRRIIRDKIIYRQLSAYDLEFAAFQRQLTGNQNAYALSTDTIVLGLGAAGTVAGGTTAKSALAAAVTFVTGTKAAVDKELFYQSTLPALKAQMEARRLQARVPIVEGLGELDAEYPLQKALVDLGNLGTAASLSAAISGTIEDAGAKASAAQVRINLAPATAEYKRATAARFSIDDRIRNLSPDQALTMARDMEPVLQGRPDDIRSRVLRYDPTNLRLKNGRAAMQVLLVWRQNDLDDPASIKQWTDELDRIEQTP
jgi:hypothetical protein